MINAVCVYNARCTLQDLRTRAWRTTVGLNYSWEECQSLYPGIDKEIYSHRETHYQALHECTDVSSDSGPFVE